jgi:hypothetical protein
VPLSPPPALKNYIFPFMQHENMYSLRDFVFAFIQPILHLLYPAIFKATFILSFLIFLHVSPLFHSIFTSLMKRKNEKLVRMAMTKG